MNSLKNRLVRLSAETAAVVVDKVVIPWYEHRTGAVVPRTAGDEYALRHEVARKTHEGLARSVWRYRGEDLPGAVELLVCDVEAETLEDGDYVLVVHLMPRNVDIEDENFDPEEIKPLPLYAFLENFVPVGNISSRDYNA